MEVIRDQSNEGVHLVILIAVFATSLTAFQAPTASGQEQGRGRGGRGAGAINLPPPTNLQILPKDWSAQQVVPVMQAFTMALGVMCNYCHVEQAGAQPGPNGQIPLDFASDSKPAKQTARVMLRAVNDINAKFDAELGKSASAPNGMRVQCVTCHRGNAKPLSRDEMT